MRNLLETAAVVLSMALLPNCAKAGLTVSVSVGCPEGYEYTDIDYDDAMDWDNVIILNDNQIGFWVLLSGNHWALRCRSMWYDSGSLEWTFGPWWYDNSISYGCRCGVGYVSYCCPFHGVRFHNYMSRNYQDWHNRYFIYDRNRYQPRAERRVVVSRGRYIRHNEPAVYRRHVTRTHIEQCRPVIDDRAITIDRRENRTERISHQSVTRPDNSHQITKTRSVTKFNRNGNSSTKTDTKSRTRHNKK
jgi:hypothetical protein